MNKELEYKKWTHFIGIGGVGMSGLARILLEKGYPVSGSDLAASEITARLEKLGARIFQGHDESYLSPQVERVIISSAIKADNPELKKARLQGIPVLLRAELLAQLMEEQKAIAVAGSHGKTTTSSMIAWCLEANGLDPTIAIGGEVTNLGENAKLGAGEYIVAEADESDGSFLKLYPQIAVVTNIEDDHMDYYGELGNLVQAFDDFIRLVPRTGFTVLFNDSPITAALGEGHQRVITYGSNPDAHYRAVQLELTPTSSKATIQYKGTYLGKLEMKIPGKHNIFNGLAAVAVCSELGIPFGKIIEALASFSGAKRRFEYVGTCRGARIVDDYAHHPTEIKATLEAARQLNPRSLWAVFQPHRYTRTEQLHEEFGRAFNEADHVVISDIYSAGEEPIPGISPQLIVDAVDSTRSTARHIPCQERIVEFLRDNCHEGDLILTLGAGDIWQVSRELAQGCS